jgi:shikimate kinase
MSVLPTKIFLIGLPGSGKSTLGKRLAALIGYTFIDLDELIEKNENMSVGTIFANHGEDHFRMLEHFCLKDAIDRSSKFVMATGGGTPCYNDNISIINKAGKSIFLNTSTDRIVDRLVKNGSNRPMFQGQNRNDISNTVTALLNNRIKFYNQAHHKTENTAPDVILGLLRS